MILENIVTVSSYSSREGTAATLNHELVAALLLCNSRGSRCASPCDITTKMVDHQATSIMDVKGNNNHICCTHTIHESNPLLAPPFSNAYKFSNNFWSKNMRVTSNISKHDRTYHVPQSDNR